MDLKKKRTQILVTLHPGDLTTLKEYCEKTDQRQATVIRDMAHACINGTVVRKLSFRNYLDVT